MPNVYEDQLERSWKMHANEARLFQLFNSQDPDPKLEDQYEYDMRTEFGKSRLTIKYYWRYKVIWVIKLFSQSD